MESGRQVAALPYEMGSFHHHHKAPRTCNGRTGTNLELQGCDAHWICSTGPARPATRIEACGFPLPGDRMSRRRRFHSPERNR
jgi:hypothetical protein